MRDLRPNSHPLKGKVLKLMFCPLPYVAARAIAAIRNASGMLSASAECGVPHPVVIFAPRGQQRARLAERGEQRLV